MLDAAIVIPVFNTSPKLFRSCLGSAAAQDTSLRYEIVVVDDGSDNPAAQTIGRIAEKFGARYLRFESNRGLAAARNAGIDRADADVVLLLDSDDVLDPRAVALLHAALDATGAVLAWADHEKRRLDGELIHRREKAAYAALAQEYWMSPWDPFTHCTFILQPNAFTKEVFSRVGGFDTKFRYGEEMEFYDRIGRAYPTTPPIAHVAEVLHTYIDNPRSICNQPAAYRLLIENTEHIFSAAARVRGLTSHRCRRIGRCKQTHAAFYEHFDAKGRALRTPWFDYEKMVLVHETVCVET